MQDEILFDYDAANGIAEITLNRPEVLNAANLPLAVELLRVVRDLSHMDGLRGVVLKGAGAGFMAGGDVASFVGTKQEARAQVNGLLDALHPAILTLRSLEAPIVAGVHGVAAGAGLSLALAADVVVASDKARFILAYDQIGATPDCGGSWFLNRRMGTGQATSLMLLSRSLNATEALQTGLVNKVAGEDEFEADLKETAAQLAKGPSRAYKAWRLLSDASFGCSLAEHLERERDSFLSLIETEDFAEGCRAFLEKRRPKFNGV